jgi:hypothetical protein
MRCPQNSLVCPFLTGLERVDGEAATRFIAKPTVDSELVLHRLHGSLQRSLIYVGASTTQVAVDLTIRG